MDTFEVLAAGPIGRPRRNTIRPSRAWNRQSRAPLGRRLRPGTPATISAEHSPNTVPIARQTLEGPRLQHRQKHTSGSIV